jgi:hypothetical protein
MILSIFFQMQRLLAARRHQMNTQGKTDIPAPQAPTPHPGYAPHAALHAIKRHAVELMNQKEQVNDDLKKIIIINGNSFVFFNCRKKKKGR